jgi:acyl-CoA:acyl-CoA alkyltransferase
MIFKNVVIEAMAYQEPSEFLTSTEIETLLAPVYQRLKLPEGRLELQTSIQRRGLWPIGTAPSRIASEAALKALKNSNIDKSQIGLLIHTSVCRDFLEPSTASVIHHHLGLEPKCMSFDLSNACLGFLNGLIVAGQMIESGKIDKALVVSGENAGPLIYETIHKLNTDQTLTRKTIKKYIANLTIGSMGVAFVLTRKDLKPNAPQILGAESLCDTSSVHLCQGSGNTQSLMMETDSEELLHAGIKLAKKTWQLTQESLKLSTSDFSAFICHQVGIAHRNLMYESLGLDLAKDFTTFNQYGNTGSAAVPLTLIKAYEACAIPSQSKVAMLGIGSGLHSVMMGIQWN